MPRCSRLLASALFLLFTACASVPRLDISEAAIALPEAPRADGLETTSSSDLETICGAVDDSQPVEAYDGSLGPTTTFVRTHQPRTVLLLWRHDLRDLFKGKGDRAGNVAGQRWCTGTLFRDDLVITAAHCFRVNPNGWKTPVRAGKAVPPAELATLMRVNFNYQWVGATTELRVPDVYEIDKLLEFGDTRPTVQGKRVDYAIVRLRPKHGIAPGKKYGNATLDSSDAALKAATELTMIQHPNGNPKRIHAGREVLKPRDALIRYADLDTLSGSSGSGILDQAGRLIGVHTNGGCKKASGYNYGASLRAISRVSDLVERKP